MLENDLKKVRQWRNVVAFWLLGFYNNAGFSSMLAAAKDIIAIDENPISPFANSTQNARDCNLLSTGTILIADVLPSVLIKSVIIFLPYQIHFRILSTVVLSAIGFLVVGLSTTLQVALLGVVSTSLSFGIGENTMFSYSSFYNDKDITSMVWSGNGAAGLLGTFAISLMTTFGLSPSTCMLTMLTIPMCMAITFWLVLGKPEKPVNNDDKTLEEQSNPDKKVAVAIIIVEENQKSPSRGNIYENLKEKLSIVPFTLKYAFPIGLIYFLQYLINQGLMELVEFDDNLLDHTAQYRWLQVAYRVGTFISQSITKTFSFRMVWVMILLQVFNLILFTTETLYFYTPNIWFVLAVAFWEGLVGGAVCVNIFAHINTKVPSDKRLFTMEMSSFFDSMGITIAGFAAMPVHAALCALPKPERKHFF